MTELGYLAPPARPSTVPEDAPRRPAWRTAVTVVATVLGPPLALFVAFAATIVWSGCFLTCGASDHTKGGLLWMLAIGLLVSGPILAATVMRSRTATLVTSAVAAGVVFLVVLRLLG